MASVRGNRRDLTALMIILLMVANTVIQALESSDNVGQWWRDPCDKNRNRRHQKHQEMLSQLNGVIKNLNTHFLPEAKLVFDLYTLTSKKGELKFAWLKFPKLNKRAAKKMKNKKYILPELHKALQIYAGTIDTLRNLTDVAVVLDNSRATILMDRVIYDLKRLICEVTHELENRNITSSLLTLEDMKINFLELRDATRANKVYLTVLKGYKLFLKKIRRIMYRKIKRKPNDATANGKQ